MKTYTFDIETYQNYTLFALRDIETHILTTFEIRGVDAILSEEDVDNLTSLLEDNRIITFNGIKFDDPITSFALEGNTSSAIFTQVQEIIVEGKSVYTFYRENHISKCIKENHIDIMDVARGQASLKLYGARLGTSKLQDLPYPPETILTREEMNVVLRYCENDNILTEELYRHLKSDLDLREAMGVEYEQDFMSFKGAKIAELILVNECKYTGKAPKIPEGINYVAPEYIKFKTDSLKILLKQITTHTFTLGYSGNVEMPDFLKEELEFDGLGYKFGLGGLHASVSSTTILPEDDELIVDIDYKSLYPSIIIENDFSPKQIGSKFSQVYRKMYDKRNKELKPAMKLCEYGSDKYKDLDKQQNTMKLVLNSSFGQTGQRFSKIYDPSTMLHTTLTGQLTLMMVIEKLARKGFKTFYANTDGITLLIKKLSLKKVQKITRKFDEKTGLEMEYNFFKASHIRDVNAFINITDDGKAKSKGTYGEPDLEKNAQTPIVFEAIRKFLREGTPIKTTIIECTNAHDFCTSRRVTGGAMYAEAIPLMYPPDWQEKLNSKRGLTKKVIAERAKLEAVWVKDHGTYLGKVVRFYYSKTGMTLHYKKTGNKVPMSDTSRPLMDLPKSFEVIKNDINYDWYYAEAERQLADLGVVFNKTKGKT